MNLDDFTQNLESWQSLEMQLETQPCFIGMMSGTSLDALDAVLCRFDDKRPIVIDSHSISFPNDLKSALLALTTPNGVNDYIKTNNLSFESELDVFGWASVFYAELAAQVVLEMLNKSNIDNNSVCAIGCHGQTVRHRPHWQFSLQLLDPNVLTERTGIAVVSDFRRRDMAVGGQGAPLAPAFHEAIFNNLNHADTKNTAVLNLGGIANITLLSDGVREVIGFDTGCANLLLDGWIQRHMGMEFDKNGEWAKSGQIIAPLLNQLLKHSFFTKPYPKSTGREEFNLTWLDEELAKFNISQSNYDNADVQATLADLTAISVADALLQIAPSGELYVCGGGALNNHLMARLAHHLPSWQIKSSGALGIPPMLVESLAFAWLAQQTMLSQVGNLPSVTGASKPVVLGQVCFP